MLGFVAHLRSQVILASNPQRPHLAKPLSTIFALSLYICVEGSSYQELSLTFVARLHYFDPDLEPSGNHKVKFTTWSLSVLFTMFKLKDDTNFTAMSNFTPFVPFCHVADVKRAPLQSRMNCL